MIDNDLLTRLNALKQSSVALDESTSRDSWRSHAAEGAPHNREDALATRLKSLRHHRSASKQAHPELVAAEEASAPPLHRASLAGQVRDSLSSERDPIRSWQHQHVSDQDERTLEELLAELGPAQEGKLAWLDPEDPKHVQSLLNEARVALRGEPELESEAQHSTQAQRSGAQHDVESITQIRKESQEDDDAAAEYVERVLADLEMEKMYGGGEPDHSEDSPKQKPSHVDLNLPSAPSTLKDLSAASHSDPPSYEDCELEARFSRLGLGGLYLPSTPTAAPSSQSKVQPWLKPKTNLPTYTDEDVGSWCCICSEDGEVRCLGCDDDIYCQNCWSDGHGIATGLERGHKAVQYTRKPSKTAAA